MRKLIDKVKNWKQFLNESKDTWYDIDDKLSILKSYIHILKNSKENYDLAISYFIVLHNFLIVERGFFDDIKLANKEINKYLKLEKLNNETDVYNKFLELYDTNHIVRNNVETIDNIDSVGDYLSKRPELFRELLKKKKIVRWIFLLKFSTKILIRTMNGTLTHNGLQLTEVGDYEVQNLNIKRMFNRRINANITTKPPLLAICCYTLFFPLCP